jgi:hypothetical protein
MIAITRPVIDYFNQRKEENEALKAAGEQPKGQLQTLFDEAESKPLKEIKARSVFKVPRIKLTKKRGGYPKTQRIAFDTDKKKADKAKEMLEAGSWREVGEEIFEYYFNAECGDARPNS